MTEMPTAAGAADLGAKHAVAAVLDVCDVGAVDRLKEAGPAGPGIELRLRREQRKAAQAAGVGSVFLVVEEVTAERRLGSVVQEDAALLLVQRLRELHHFLFTQRRDVIPGG